MSFIFKRYPQAPEPSSYPIMDPSYVPAGPEAAPTLAEAAASSPTYTVQTLSSSDGVLSTSTITSLTSLLAFFGLLLIAFVLWKVRGRWRKSNVSEERTAEKDDVEAQTPTRSTIPVTPQTGVRWQPQIRSISGPAPTDKRGAALSPCKRARSPPPTRTYSPKIQDPFGDPYPKSAPPSAVSFSEESLRPPPRGSRVEMVSPPVSPHALAVSGMQTRSLSRPSQLSKNVDA